MRLFCQTIVSNVKNEVKCSLFVLELEPVKPNPGMIGLNVTIVSDLGGEGKADPQSKALDLLVNLHQPLSKVMSFG